MSVRVSIMITCYNCEDCIDDAINSVVSQDMPFQWELLIGDDGSSDNTVSHIKDWIRKYPDNIVLYIMERNSNEEKNGTRAAKNRANLLEHAVGDYLIFLDGDDRFLGTEKIKRQVEILDLKDYKNCSCVAHNILANDTSNRIKYPLTDKEYPEGIVDSHKYWRDLYFHTNTILFRRCCVETMLNDKYCDYLNDNFITYIVLQYGKIYYLKQIWGQYNLTGNGLWTGKKRIYGCFRNMILYDLELKINPKMGYDSFVRHLYDFRYIYMYYKTEDKELIKMLMNNLLPQQFHYTFLLYRFNDELQMNEKFEKVLLKIKVDIVFLLNRILKVPKHLKKSVHRKYQRMN